VWSMVRKNKQAQFKIQQMAFMIIAVFIFFTLVGLGVVGYYITSIKSDYGRVQEQVAVDSLEIIAEYSKESDTLRGIFPKNLSAKFREKKVRDYEKQINQLVYKFMKKLPDNQIVFYQSQDGSVNIEVFYVEENIWLTQKKMAELFDTTPPKYYPTP